MVVVDVVSAVVVVVAVAFASVVAVAVALASVVGPVRSELVDSEGPFPFATPWIGAFEEIPM